MFQRVGSSRSENEETKWCKMIDTDTRKGRKTTVH